MAASTSGTTCPVTVRYTTLWGTTRCRLTTVDDTGNEVNAEPETTLELSA